MSYEATDLAGTGARYLLAQYGEAQDLHPLGPYSVPRWAEPTGALGTVPAIEWFRHNPYAEWYANTIRIPGTPAARHHQEVFSDAPYDDFLDQWTASNFDPAAWTQPFAEAGGRGRYRAPLGPGGGAEMLAASVAEYSYLDGPVWVARRR